MKRRCLHCEQPLQAGTVGRFCSTCVLHVPLIDLRRDELVAAVKDIEAKRRRMRLQIVYGDGPEAAQARNARDWRNRVMFTALTAQKAGTA